MNNYKNIKIEKSMYNSAKPFSEVLEALDPSEQYAGTALEGSDAFQRQLKRFDIKVSGENSDRVEKFFRTSESAVLFPEYVSRAVKQGINSKNVLSDIIATSTKIDGIDYRTIMPLLPDEEKELNDVSEGASIPQVELKISDKLVKLDKRGKLLVASYETIKYQRIDVFTIALKQIGASIAKTQIKDLYSHIIEDVIAGKYEVVSMGEEVSFSDFLDLKYSFGDYRFNTLLCSPGMAKKLYSIEEFNKAATDAKYPLTGESITPFGANVVVIDAMDDGFFIALDKDYAYEYVQAGEVLTEYDKLIDRQLERAAITVTGGFNTLFAQAVKVLAPNS